MTPGSLPKTGIKIFVFIHRSPSLVLWIFYFFAIKWLSNVPSQSSSLIEFFNKNKCQLELEQKKNKKLHYGM